MKMALPDGNEKQKWQFPALRMSTTPTRNNNAKDRTKNTLFAVAPSLLGKSLLSYFFVDGVRESEVSKVCVQ